MRSVTWNQRQKPTQAAPDAAIWTRTSEFSPVTSLFAPAENIIRGKAMPRAMPMAPVKDAARLMRPERVSRWIRSRRPFVVPRPLTRSMTTPTVIYPMWFAAPSFMAPMIRHSTANEIMKFRISGLCSRTERWRIRKLIITDAARAISESTRSQPKNRPKPQPPRAAPRVISQGFCGLWARISRRRAAKSASSGCSAQAQREKAFRRQSCAKSTPEERIRRTCVQTVPSGPVTVAWMLVGMTQIFRSVKP